MPGFDGTGPQGKGPMTGRGEGYCVIKLDPGETLEGYAGVDNRPVRLEQESSGPEPIARFSRWICSRGSKKKGRRANRR